MRPIMNFSEIVIETEIENAYEKKSRQENGGHLVSDSMC